MIHFWRSALGAMGYTTVLVTTKVMVSTGTIALARSQWARQAALGLLLAVSALCAGPVAAEALRVCIPDDTPPYSWREKGAEQGFDVAVAQRLAAALKRDLSLFWYDNEYDRESDGTLGVNALLSAGLCEVVAGYTLYAPALGKPWASVARTPGYRGAKPPRQRPWITLGTTIPSRAYHSAQLALIVGPATAGRTVDSLADLSGMKLGTVAGSMGGTILRGYRKGIYLKDSVSLQSIVDPLDGLEAGRFAATLTDVHSLDAWRVKHPQNHLTLTTYRHPAAFNIGFVALAGSERLVRQLNDAIAALLAVNELANLAAANAMTWMAPVEPQVAIDRSIAQLIEMAENRQ